MKLLLVILSCLIGLGNSLSLTGIIRPADSGSKCVLKAGEQSNVICVSKTQFVFPFQDPWVDAPIKCPQGTFCADTPDVCSATETPICPNDIPGVKDSCNVCVVPEDGGYSPLCKLIRHLAEIMELCKFIAPEEVSETHNPPI